jgi:immune inhibitor A
MNINISSSIKLASTVLAFSLASTAFAMPQDGGPPGLAKKGDNYSHPLGKKQKELKQKALQAKLQGKTKGKTHQVAKGQFVELEREGEDLIWTVLGQFSDFDHNMIAKPDANNNSTIWREDFSQQHYMDLLFSEEADANSMRNFYIELSSNRYTVDGDVTDWVSVPGTAESYDDADRFALWSFLTDSVDGWYQNQIDDGMTEQQINDYLSKFDVWDRYDHDNDGDFNEPDGYIDHFQSIHAGEGEEAGGGSLGGSAIWSHRWYAHWEGIGFDGPAENQAGGVQVGNSNYWIGDYTIEPENGGVGVFAHEFAHDLGLPDLYATQGASNSTGFWTLMSSGSWLGDGTKDIGSMPGHMGAWEKLQLGWLNYEVANAGEKSQHKLGPAATNTKQAQAVIVILPEKEVATQIGDPYAGDSFYYSGAGNDIIGNTMSKAVNLGAGSSLTAQVNADIEYQWDYAYLEISTDNGANWSTVKTNASEDVNPNGNNDGNGITGSSGGNWFGLTADLSATTGDAMLRFRYSTDSAVIGKGIMIDNISITGLDLDGAEADAGWEFSGFSVSDGVENESFFNAYIAAYRTYYGYDKNLEVGPYNFGFGNDPSTSNKVEHYPYQDGLLISYWDRSQIDNNVSVNGGQGLILPIDAHPETMVRSDGENWSPRVQAYDSTFSIEATDAITLHKNSLESLHQSQPGVRVFNDNIDYWNSDTPNAGVKNPHTGTQIWIKSISAKGNFMQIQVSPVK